MTGVNVGDWVAKALPEEREFRLEDEHPEAMEALREAGYEGEAWLRIRALSAALDDARNKVAFSGEVGTDTWHIDHPAATEFDYRHMIVDGRLPTDDGDEKLQEYVWATLSGHQNKNLELLRRIDSRSLLLSWIKKCLAEMRGEDKETVKEIKEAEKFSPAAES